MQRKDSVAIVGAGITGVLAAYELVQRGFAVELYEAMPEAAQRCSRANGGQLSTCNAQVWNNPKTVLKAMKWLFDSQAPLKIDWMPEWGKVRWLSEFVARSFLPGNETRTIKTIRMGLKSHARYLEIMKEEDVRFEYRACGIAHIYQQEEALIEAAKLQHLFEQWGCSWKPITEKELLALDPALRHTQTPIAGAIWTPEDAVGDIHQFCVNLLQKMQDKKLVTVHFEHRLDELVPMKDRVQLIVNPAYSEAQLPQDAAFDVGSPQRSQAKEAQLHSLLKGNQQRIEHRAVVLCNGHDAQRFGWQVGTFLNVYPVKGYTVTLDLVGVAPEDRPTISLLDDAAKVACSRLGDQLRVAGTAQLGGTSRALESNRIEPLLRWAEKTFPAVGREHYKPWTCHRPMSASMLPTVGPSRATNSVWFHTGHGHLGWTLGAASAQTLAQEMKRVLG